MSRASPGQMKKLLELMSEDGTLKSGKVVYTASLNRQEFWRRIAMQLNAIDGGVYKNTWKWCKMWADWKNKTKKKANILLRKTYSLDEPKPSLTSLEFRLLKLIGYPMDKTSCLELEPIHKMEDLEDPMEEQEREFFAADVKTQSDNEDNTAIQFLVHSNINEEFASAEKLLRKGHAEYLDDGSGNEKMYAKSKGKKYRKKRRTLEDASSSAGPVDSSVLEQYKLKTSLALEREKLRQRDEELRLRALELKLKGDELRLKEAEMNKINFLTNVEEEKLKCFRDVASLLKELVERTKNGNPNPPRFHNII